MHNILEFPYVSSYSATRASDANLEVARDFHEVATAINKFSTNKNKLQATGRVCGVPYAVTFDDGIPLAGAHCEVTFLGADFHHVYPRALHNYREQQLFLQNGKLNVVGNGIPISNNLLIWTFEEGMTYAKILRRLQSDYRISVVIVRVGPVEPPRQELVYKRPLAVTLETTHLTDLGHVRCRGTHVYRTTGYQHSRNYQFHVFAPGVTTTAIQEAIQKLVE